MQTSIFFSYARTDSDRVLPLAKDLIANGLDLWVDQWRIPAGAPWDDTVMGEIAARNTFIVALTRISVQRTEVRNEIAEALSKGARVIPVMYETCEVPYRIARLHQIRLFPDPARGLHQLLMELGVTFDRTVKEEIDQLYNTFVEALCRPTNINAKEWDAPISTFLKVVATAKSEDTPQGWFRVLEAGREFRDVIGRVPAGDVADPYPGHSSPLFGPLVMLTDRIDRELAEVTFGVNLTGANALGALEQAVSETDLELLNQTQKQASADSPLQGNLDRARMVIVNDIQPALERVRSTRHEFRVSEVRSIRSAIEATHIAISRLVNLSDSFVVQVRTAILRVKLLSDFFIEDTQHRFKAFRESWSNQSDRRIRFVEISVGNGEQRTTVQRLPGSGVPFHDPVALDNQSIPGPDLVVVPAERPFCIGIYPIQFKEWDAAQGHPDWQRFALIEPRRAEDYSWGRDSHPVIDLSWADAIAYCKWLSGTTGRSYRLPSHNEWEHCCRAGTTTQYWWGDEPSTDRANYNGGSNNGYLRHTKPVGSYQANPWGLYQVHGNVWEWCEDEPSQGHRGLRGGSWSSFAKNLRCANRDALPSCDRHDNIGFRVVRDL